MTLPLFCVVWWRSKVWFKFVLKCKCIGYFPQIHIQNEEVYWIRGGMFAQVFSLSEGSYQLCPYLCWKRNIWLMGNVTVFEGIIMWAWKSNSPKRFVSDTTAVNKWCATGRTKNPCVYFTWLSHGCVPAKGPHLFGNISASPVPFKLRDQGFSCTNKKEAGSVLD